MDKVKLANLIADSIKDDVNVFELAGTAITFNPINFNPTINIMEETEDGPRIRFHIEVVDVLDIVEKEDE
jgi:hypothetical protein